MQRKKNLEGLAITKNDGLYKLRIGDRVKYIINDNDGVDGSNGETQLLQIKHEQYHYEFD